jgi:ATP-dependent Clp protease protease subunit
MMSVKENLIRILADNTSRTYDEVYSDCERNNWMSARQAVEYGIVDSVVENRR